MVQSLVLRSLALPGTCVGDVEGRSERTIEAQEQN